MYSLAFDIRSRSTVILASAFVLWSLLVIYGGTEWFDFPISEFFGDATREGPLDLFMRSLTEIGDVFYMLGFAIVLIIIRPTRKIGITLLILLVLTTLVTGYVKCGVDRERPEPETSSAFPIDISQDTFSLFCAGSFDASYPSGHASRAAALGTVLAIALATKFPRVAPILLLYPVMMSISRVYVLQHYPSDVIGGVLLGVLFAGVVSKMTHIDASKSKTF
ncbi:MAG: phosphatase PAP2 family protein [Cenarchaeum symbiont of Oopsacas minuta]|nr:phosphatase PAP2 family protein [Cenarchaeum symbiont of Oopsacas minuta]